MKSGRRVKGKSLKIHILIPQSWSTASYLEYYNLDVEILGKSKLDQDLKLRGSSFPGHSFLPSTGFNKKGKRVEDR